MNGDFTIMNQKTLNNNFLDLNLFKTKEDAKKFILETKLEIEDINNQIKDFVELLEVSRKIDNELDLDPDWIPKAQYARRIKLNHIYTVEQWLCSQSKPNDINLALKVSLLEEQLNSLKKRLEKEKERRTNAIKNHHNQIGFTYRAIRELYNLLCLLFKDKEFPVLPSQSQLTWVDETIALNSNALLFNKIDEK